MSMEATLATWELDKQQVNGTEKLLLLSLARRAGEDHTCWPSVKRIVADTGLNRKTVIDVRQSLIEKKLISYTGRMVGRSNQIPEMKIDYVDEWEQKRNSPRLKENDLQAQQNVLTCPEIGTRTSPKNGTRTSPNIGTLNSTVEYNNGMKIKNSCSSDEERSNNNQDSSFQPIPKDRLETLPFEKPTPIPDEQKAAKCEALTNGSFALAECKAEPSPWFEIFWEYYPRKDGKKDALKSWIKNKLDAIGEKIVMDVRDRALKADNWRDKRYIPLPATYLNGERWNDEIIGQQQNRKENEQQQQARNPSNGKTYYDKLKDAAAKLTDDYENNRSFYTV